MTQSLFRLSTTIKEISPNYLKAYPDKTVALHIGTKKKNNMDWQSFYDNSLFSFADMMPPFLHRVFRTFRYLSLDVVAGGVVFSLGLAHLYHVSLMPGVTAALACAIWLIYTLDHLVDALSHESTPCIARHAFHLKHKRALFVVFLVIAILGLALLFSLPYLTLVYGCFLAGLIGIYFFTIWYFRLFFAKELLVGVLYASGVFIGTFSVLLTIHWSFYWFFVQSISVAVINLLLFSRYETAHDLADGHQSWATRFGVVRTQQHLNALFYGQFSLLVMGFWWFSGDRMLVAFESILLLMTFVLWLIHHFPKWFAEKERYRWAGDFVFLFIVLIFLF